MEIYNETLIDLLNIKKTVKIKETFHGVKVDATYKVTTSPEEVLELMREVNINLYYFYQVFASYNLTLYLLRLLLCKGIVSICKHGGCDIDFHSVV